MKTFSRVAIVVGLFLAMGITSIALAEEQTADNMQIVRDKIQADKKLFIAENMNLTEKEAKAFWPVYASYQKELMKLNDRSVKLIQDYADNAAQMTDAAAKKLVDDFLTIEGDRQKLRHSYLPKVAKVLPYTKVMRYYQLENKIHAAVSYDLARQIPLAK